MTQATTGNFIWYDLLAGDPAKAIAFYTQVMGWKEQVWGDNGYTMFASSQGPIGGVMRLPEQASKMGAPPHWTSNVVVENVDATVDQVKKLGGKIYVEPNEIPTVGRFAVIADPLGASINVFAPKEPMDLHDPTKPGEVCWNELATTDHEAAFAFYGKLFGWTKSRDHDMGPMGKYLIYGKSGKDFGGMFTKPKEMPVSAWSYYIEAASLSTAVERAKGLGAKVLNGPMEVPGGAHIAQLMDPQGAMFSLHEQKKG